ncbi:MAG: hypothetical protein JWM95_235 [Gemmatimonadetes bacterium]|nr:hypothetical protein [Gemmatimonadota bacterium]
MAPVTNLMWMAWRAGIAPKVLEGLSRGYAAVEGRADDPESLYAAVFLRALEDVAERGVLKRYVSHNDDPRWGGRIEIARSIERHYARGVRFRHSFVRTELTADNTANRILKHTIHRLLRHFERSGRREDRILASGFRHLLLPLTGVEQTAIDDHEIARSAEAVIRSLPQSHRHYEPALWLAYLIASRSVVILEQIGRVEFETLVVDAASIFEAYVRAICLEHQGALLCTVHDGNREQLRLFRQGASYPIKPDVYFRRGAAVIGVADAKYKLAPSEQDRYEVLSYCEATQSKRAALVCPAIADQTLASVVGVTSGGIRVHLLRFNLAAGDMLSEEHRFVEEMRGVLA